MRDSISIAKIDKNMAIPNTIQRDHMVFHSVLQEPFKVYGVYHENGCFRRLPEKVAAEVSEGVYNLSTNTAGGRVRFITDSPSIAISADMWQIGKMSHFALTGSAGFDLYENEDGQETYFGTFRPPFQIAEGYESRIELGERKWRQLTINFPLYSGVKDLCIGICEDSSVKSPLPYRYDNPVVYYGSSVLQGGCASRPGNAYPAILSRWFQCDHVNLGFSGSAKGEVRMAEYISQLAMKMFVYAYDGNAPDKEHLLRTHSRMFNIIREANPDLPIVFISSVGMKRFYDDRDARKQIIFDTFQSAVNKGDNNVYFLDGSKIWGEKCCDCTVDGCHPNDLGFYYMAEAVRDVMSTIFNRTIC